MLPFEDENLPIFTVGQVAQMLEVQQAFLRRLDEFGVVCPSRSAGGQRRYSRTEVTVVRYVAQLADEGMTLAAIRRVLELESQVRRLQAERDALIEARDALLRALAQRDHLLASLAVRQPPAAPGASSGPAPSGRARPPGPSSRSPGQPGSSAPPGSPRPPGHSGRG